MLKHNLFGAFLKEKRQQKNISLRELSYKANVAHTYIAKIENGSKPPPSDKILFRLAKGLKLDDGSAEIFFDLAAKCKRINDDKIFIFLQIFLNICIMMIMQKDLSEKQVSSAIQMNSGMICRNSLKNKNMSPVGYIF